MKKLKIAVLIDWYLPGTKAGGPVRSVYSLINIMKEQCDIYLITTNQDLGEVSPYPDIAANEWLVDNGVHYYYFSAGALSSDKMQQILQQLNPDLIYLNSFWSVNFSINIVRLKNRGVFACPVLLAPRGMLGKGALSLKSFKKNVYLGLARMFGWYKNILFHATQQQEEHDIRKKFASTKIFTAPNINSSPPRQNKSVKEKNQVRLFYLSRISRVKNLHFALEVLSAISSEYLVEYDIYGNIEDQDYWKECEEIISKLPGNIKVRYVKELRFDDVQNTIDAYHCLFLPTLNENFGHSIVESLLCGCLVIVSDQTPWNTVNEEGVGYAIGLNDRVGFVKAVQSFAAMDMHTFSQKSTGAINYIRKKIETGLVAGQYKTMFDECVKN